MTFSRAVPMLSPVLEDFVPPQFRGNMSDDVDSFHGTATEPAPEDLREGAGGTSSGGNGKGVTRIYANIILKLLRWRNKLFIPTVPQKKPVKIHKLYKMTRSSKKYRRKSATLHSINPLCLFAKLRDRYINMMNGVASSRNLNYIGGNYCTMGGEPCSREFDTESLVKLRAELEGTRPNPTAAFSWSASRVEPFGGGTNIQFARCTSQHPAADWLSRSLSVRKNGDGKFFTSRQGSKKGASPNPYASSDWTADRVASDDPRSVRPKTGGFTVAPNGDSNFRRRGATSGSEDRLKKTAMAGTNFSFHI